MGDHFTTIDVGRKPAYIRTTSTRWQVICS